MNAIKATDRTALGVSKLKGGCTGLSESTLVKIPHCWKSHVTAHISITEFLMYENIFVYVI